MPCLLLLAIWLAPAVAWAEEQVPARAEVSLTGAVLQMVAALALVLGLLLLLYWLLRRFSHRQLLGQGGGLKVWARLNLGPRKSLAVVEVGRRMLVLGLGEKEVSLLKEIDDPEEMQEVKNNSGVSAFARKSRDGFMQILKGRQNHEL